MTTKLSAGMERWLQERKVLTGWTTLSFWADEAAALIRAYEEEREARIALDKVRKDWDPNDLFLSKEAKDFVMIFAKLEALKEEIEKDG